MPPFSWSTLIGLVAERKIVPVIGQDLLQVATPLGEMPLYRFIALRVAEALEIDPPAPDTPTPLHAVATMYLEKGGGWQDIYSTVNEVTDGAVSSIEPPAALLDLAAIEPFSLFVTTTFDPLLERALNRVRYGGKDDTRVIAFTPTQTKDLPDRTYDSSTACVFHLFGRSSTSPDYAVTEEDILEFMNLLQSDVKRPQNLFRELAQRDLLIIGNSFSDWVGRFFIRVTRQERVWITETRINSYVADDTVRKDRFFDRSKNVKVYDGTPAQFVAELRRRWSERVERDRKTSAQPAIERVPGSVFISYASEDRPLAKAVADALAAANIDVWFDRTDLEGGDDYARKIAGAIDRCAVF